MKERNQEYNDFLQFKKERERSRSVSPVISSISRSRKSGRAVDPQGKLAKM